MKLPPVDYASPRSINQAIELLQKHEPNAKILSGGQSLIPMLAFRLASCNLLIDLKRVPDLDQILIDKSGVELGAKVRWRDIENDRQLPDAHPLLYAAVEHIAHYQIRNRGTVGGSLAHADPAAELPAVAVVCDAEVVVVGPCGRRSIAANAFFLGPLMTALEPCEVIIALRLPAWPRGRRYGFEEFARRRGDFALAGTAVAFDENELGQITNPRIGAFGIADTPLRLAAAEKILEGALPSEDTFLQAARIGTENLEIRADIHADREYRHALLQSLIVRALSTARRTRR